MNDQLQAVGPLVKTLEVAECRYITDEGILYLTKCRYVMYFTYFFKDVKESEFVDKSV